LAKNDCLDARLLADFGQSIEPRFTSPTGALQKQIGEFFALNRLLIEQRTALVNQLEHFHCAQACRLVQKALKNLQAQIKQASQKLKALIAQDAPTAQQIQRLCSIKGVGFQTALSVSCFLPEIGSISTKQLAALVGVALLSVIAARVVPNVPSMWGPSQTSFSTLYDCLGCLSLQPHPSRSLPALNPVG
jgi:transposase